MAAATANVGSFSKNSANGVTAYGTTVHFTIPANAGITGCSVTFVTHSSGGHTQDRGFALNGARAHSSGSWAQAGALDHTLLNAGDNTFRVTLKSQAGAACWWNIASIVLTITYTELGGGTPAKIIGTLTVSPISLTAGQNINIKAGASDGDIVRDIGIKQGNTIIQVIAAGYGSVSGEWNFTIPESWCASYAQNDPNFGIVVYLEGFIVGGGYGGYTAQTAQVAVPESALPTIGDFAAVLNANGVDASITGYVQNYSKVDLSVANAAGALGSTIESCEITGGGWSGGSAGETFGPFAQTGNITFTAKVTDSRGRISTDTVTINVLSYVSAVFSNPEAWRSSDAGAKNQKGTYARLFSGVSYSDLDSQNSVTLKGRVYPKGGTVPAYTDMTPDTPWIAGAGLLLVTKTYIAQMLVEDLISARIIEFIIPTKKTGISIMAGMQGIAFGKSAEIPGYAEFGWPIYNCPYEVGDILQTLNASSPEDRWPGTEWEAITGRVLVGLDSAQTEFDTAGEEGGEKTHTLIADEMPEHVHEFDLFAAGGPTNPAYATGVANGYYIGSQNTKSSGGGEAHNNLQPYKVVYMWMRTA